MHSVKLIDNRPISSFLFPACFIGIPLPCFLNLGYECVQHFALVVRQIFLFVFIQQIQQMNVAALLQVQKQIPISTSFPLAAHRIRASRFAKPAQSLQHTSTSGILQQVGLDGIEHLKR